MAFFASPYNAGAIFEGYLKAPKPIALRPQVDTLLSMSYVLASPQLMAEAAAALASIGSTMSTANADASASTTEVAPPAADAVSAALAALFGAHALGYQKFSAEVVAFHDRFVQAVTTGAASYATVEAANAPTLL